MKAAIQEFAKATAIRWWARYGARGELAVDAVSDAGGLTILERRGEELWRFLHRAITQLDRW